VSGVSTTTTPAPAEETTPETTPTQPEVKGVTTRGQAAPARRHVTVAQGVAAQFVG
jgi:hypothetical protein